MQLFTQCCFDLLLKNYTEAEIRNSKSSFVSKNASVSFSKRRSGKGGRKGRVEQAGERKKAITSGRFAYVSQ